MLWPHGQQTINAIELLYQEKKRKSKVCLIVSGYLTPFVYITICYTKYVSNRVTSHKMDYTYDSHYSLRPYFTQVKIAFIDKCHKNQFPYNLTCGLYCTFSAYFTLVKPFFNDHFPKNQQSLRPHVMFVLPILVLIDHSQAVF